MSIQAPGETSLRVQEVILLIDIELLVIVTAFVIVELVVDTIGLITHMAILDITKHIPLFINVIGGLYEYVAIELMGIRVIVLIVTVSQILLAYNIISRIGHVAEVVAIEVLD